MPIMPSDLISLSTLIWWASFGAIVAGICLIGLALILMLANKLSPIYAALLMFSSMGVVLIGALVLPISHLLFRTALSVN